MNKSVGSLKVFHGLVNYGTQAGIFAKYLRENGIKALSVSTSDRFNRSVDIELLHGGAMPAKVLKHIWNGFKKLWWFFSYNTFHFYYGTTLFPCQIDLPFYRLFGKKVIMHYLGNDVQGYKQSVVKYRWTNMTGFINGHDPDEHDRLIEKRICFEARHVDRQFVCAPIYSEFVMNSFVLPLAVDIDNYTYSPPPLNEKLIVMHAPSHRASKGSDFIIAAVRKLISEGAMIELNLVENVTHDKLKQEYIRSDIYIDQVLSGWYGTASIEAMAFGRPVICSIRKSYYSYIDYGEMIPILNADPDTIYDSIKFLAENRGNLTDIGMKCRKFVEEVHDARILVRKLINYYEKIWSD